MLRPNGRLVLPPMMGRRQGDPGARLQLRIPGPFGQAERLFLVGPGGIQLVQSFSTLGAPPHCTPFLEVLIRPFAPVPPPPGSSPAGWW
jgi:hypothetical protein